MNPQGHPASSSGAKTCPEQRLASLSSTLSTLSSYHSLVVGHTGFLFQLRTFVLNNPSAQTLTLLQGLCMTASPWAASQRPSLSSWSSVTPEITLHHSTLFYLLCDPSWFRYEMSLKSSYMRQYKNVQR